MLARASSFALSLLIAGGPAVANDPGTDAEPEAGGKRAPKTELRNLTVTDELAVDLFAAEPMLLSPSNIRFWTVLKLTHQRVLNDASSDAARDTNLCRHSPRLSSEPAMSRDRKCLSTTEAPDESNSSWCSRIML